jgi:hypothetical protein
MSAGALSFHRPVRLRSFGTDSHTQESVARFQSQGGASTCQKLHQINRHIMGCTVINQCDPRRLKAKGLGQLPVPTKSRINLKFGLSPARLKSLFQYRVRDLNRD